MSRHGAIPLLFTLAITAIGGHGRARAGVVSQWLFNETGGTTAHDSVGGIDGTLSGGATFDPGAGPGRGIYSGAISLSAATDSYISMGDVYNFTSGDFSVVAWVETTSTGGEFAVSRHHSGFLNGYFVALNNVGDGLTTVGSHLYTSGSGAVSSADVENGQWHQLAGVYQAGVGTSYYVDGVLQGTGGAAAIGANDAPFMVGGVDASGTIVGAFTGLISDVSVYDSALSASEVKTLYDQVINTQSVPEPSSLVMALIGSGLLGGYGMIRRRRGGQVSSC